MVQLKVRGISRLERNLKVINERLNKDIQQGLKQSSNIIIKEAKRIVPVKTGRLRKSIKGRIKPRSLRVGSDVEYAPFVELGTRFQRAQAFLLPALQHSRLKIQRVFQKILGKTIKVRLR